ncbi:MAG: 23S rRNA (adenine(2503)-C(2))-methyltransferase RlmN [Desulfobulbaceae bacterium]|jgi:23S rRNA (adenine2503-C2)-methyltransferase|nr:23S rRNA (adenine(2503)-C(2))-methyltransferase RlmN [Desulfobulbaceae bacterium]
MKATGRMIIDSPPGAELAMPSSPDLKDFDQRQLIDFLASLGQPAFRGRQVMAWLYRYGIDSPAQMTDLAKSCRELLAANAVISRFDDPIAQKSRDGSVKFGFRLDDGHLIESVLIPEEDRNTLCISSQVGCAMGCAFCLTAKIGFIRNLRPAEIVNQVCAVRDYLVEQPQNSLIGPDRVTNLVFMGMGEPLNNLSHVVTAISILTEQRGFDLTGRRITVSTCGIVPKMRELGERCAANLAVSLHAVDDRLRDRLMPVNRRYPVAELLAACRSYPMPKRRRIMFEYLMLKGVNDSEDDARSLAVKLRGIPCKINLLPFNECQDSPYVCSDMDAILRFQKILLAAHYSVFIRQSRGGDIAAACGQLAGQL